MEHFLSPRMGRVEHIHFVGIGGTGMCGIAEVLHNEGYHITGSDLSETNTVARLQSLGITVLIGHCNSYIDGADVVVCSTAIDDNNPEIMAARAKRIPILPRAAMLAELMRFRYGIAIAGTHGKTTTTSLVSNLLIEGGCDPSFVIGGKLTSSGSNAQLGKSGYFIAEADESDASFLFLKPMMAVVTNIDADHMATYDNNFDKLRETFVEFLHHLPFYGLAVVCVEDENIRRILPDIQRPTATYGFCDEADYKACDWTQTGMLSRFVVHRPYPHSPLSVQMNWPGRHNVLNALAAIAIATEVGVDDVSILRGLLNFQGVGRRFQLLGERRFTYGSALVIDDYGHHPQEIKATLNAFRAVWPDKRLIHVFQPHRYTRTESLFSQFVDVLKMADELLLLDIYPAGESALPGVSSEVLAHALNEYAVNVTLVTEKNLEHRLNQMILDNDVVLMQGAGSIGQMAVSLMQARELV
jgi:UDP-N-acetylmuramate--alanine ligase